MRIAKCMGFAGQSMNSDKIVYQSEVRLCVVLTWNENWNIHCWKCRGCVVRCRRRRRRRWPDTETRRRCVCEFVAMCLSRVLAACNYRRRQPEVNMAAVSSGQRLPVPSQVIRSFILDVVSDRRTYRDSMLNRSSEQPATQCGFSLHRTSNSLAARKRCGSTIYGDPSSYNSVPCSRNRFHISQKTEPT